MSKRDIPVYEVAARGTLPWCIKFVTLIGESPITQDDVVDIRLDVSDMVGSRETLVDQAGSAVVGDAAWAIPDKEDVIFNEWQTGPEWREDSEGYNGRLKIAFPFPGHTYLARLVVTLDSGDVLMAVAKFVTY